MVNTVSMEKAYLYEKYRLPYAEEAAGDLLERIGGAQVVADIGAGTGQVARLFAGRCDRVFAVEPDASMRTVAGETLEGLPAVEVVDGSAESTTLAGGSVDLIVIGNAFHRFRPEACDELRRVLKEKGWIALFSYAYLNGEFTEELFSRLSELKGLTSRIEKAWHRPSVEQLFGGCEMQALSYRQSLNEGWEAFFGAARAGIEAPEKGDGDFARFEEINREIFDAYSVDGRMRIDYETRVSFGRPQR